MLHQVPGETQHGQAAKKGRGINSILNGFRLLQVLAEHGVPMSLKELSQQAKLSPNQAHAYLISLKQVRVVEQDPASGRYHLGHFALILGLARLRAIEPLEKVIARATELARETDFMVMISVFGSTAPVVVRVLNPPRYFMVAARVGHVPSLIDTCTGRVFAAFLSKKEMLPLIDAEFAMQPGRGFPTTYTPQMLTEELATIRSQRFGAAKGVPNPYLTSIAAPIYNSFGQIECVLTLTAPATHISVDQESDDVRRLLSVTDGLSAELGYGFTTDVATIPAERISPI
jgi:DNA-binding IclR family transcriptional regulator